MRDVDAGGAQASRTVAADVRVRIARADDDAAHAGGDHRIGARRRAAVMGARLERHVERRAARPRAGIAQRLGLAVRRDRPCGGSRARRPSGRATTTAPTGGFGLVRPSPRRPRRSARRM